MKYSSLKKRIVNEKSGRFLPFADAITHYWQNKNDESGRHFKIQAENHAIDEISDLFEIDSIKYDVPFPPPESPDFKFIDLFAGIGGFRIAFQEQNGKCVFSSEWDRWSQKTYESNFAEVPYGDISNINENDIPDHDILIGGFPCQPFSLAGVSKKNSLGRSHGFQDETQGTLFFDIKRILKAKKPKAFLLENVKNLKSHDNKHTFEVIESTLKSLGYHVFSHVIDAANYVPQHRERIFIVGFSKEHYVKEVDFHFPVLKQEKHKFGDILEGFGENLMFLPDLTFMLPDLKNIVIGKLN